MKKAEQSKWDLDRCHPLFRGSCFPFPAVDNRGNLEYLGFYNPIVDAMAFQFTPDADNQTFIEVWQHETVHRTLSPFYAPLRRLVSISHTLIHELLDIAKKMDTMIEGKYFGDLKANKKTDEKLIEDISMKLLVLDGVYESFYWSLIPPVEMAAIDFLAANGWSLIPIAEIEAHPKIKDRLINQLAEWLERSDSILYHFDIKTILKKTWEEYQSIENPTTRQEILKFVIPTGILLNDYNISSADKSFEILDIIQSLVSEEEKRKGKEENLTDVLIDYSFEIENVLEDWRKWALADVPDPCLEFFDIADVINEIISMSPVTYDEYFNDPAISCLFIFWIDADGKLHKGIDSNWLDLVENLNTMYPHLPNLKKDWWQKLALIETIRQSLRTGKSVTCPFLDLSCEENCPIKEMIVWLQAYTEISIDGTFCSTPNKYQLPLF